MKKVRAFCADPEVLARADKMAEILGISFSKLVVNALKKYEEGIDGYSKAQLGHTEPTEFTKQPDFIQVLANQRPIVFDKEISTDY
jgi:hypothetical protein